MTLDFNALRAMGDPRDMIAHLEGLKTQAEERLAQLEEARTAIADLTVTATDDDGAATVTIGRDGYITELVISQWVSRSQYRFLGAAILDALSNARRELEERLQEIRPQ